MEDPESKRISDPADLRRRVHEIVAAAPTIDMHTHLYPMEFGDLNLSGIDDLLTYHYLVAELFRSSEITPERFWNLNKQEQADIVWQAIFVENTPISEAALGIVTIMSAFGIDPNTEDLATIRDFFRSQETAEHINRVFEIAGVSAVVMTNDPFDEVEAGIWERAETFDQRFHAALRMDRMLNDWKATAGAFSFDEIVSGNTVTKLRTFFDAQIAKMKPLYMAVSLPDDFDHAAKDTRNLLIREVVLPTALEHSLPFALMVGVRRNVNPALRSAGDGVGKADIRSLEVLCAENPDVKFFATYLSRENQHELCVTARKFSNLMPFGCWWFLNNPSIISEITRERLEMLGTSFIPQHSDARVLEQLIYKWSHSRRVIAAELTESYERLLRAGRTISDAEIERVVAKLFSNNFRKFVGLDVAQPK